MQTNRSFHAEAERALYRCITFIEGSSAASKICSALLAGAAKHVHSLSVDICQEYKRGRKRSLQTRFHHLPLAKMGRLHSLVISSFGKKLVNWDQRRLFHFLTSSIRDHTLVKFHAPGESSPECVTFLTKQRNIRDLFVWNFELPSTGDCQSPDFLPFVERLGFEWSRSDTSDNFILTRPITSLKTTPLWNFQLYFFPIATQLTALDLWRVWWGEDYAPQFVETIVSAAINLRIFQYSRFRDVTAINGE